MKFQPMDIIYLDLMQSLVKISMDESFYNIICYKMTHLFEYDSPQFWSPPPPTGVF